jgi:osmotically-inducible protein OsmY
MSRRIAAAALAVGFLIGCDGQDPERLKRVGSRLTERGRALEATVRKSMPDAKTDGRPSARVEARLRADKILASVPIQVRADGNKVRLSGRVADESLRRRAVELAETTVGVDGVVDEMEAP